MAGCSDAGPDECVGGADSDCSGVKVLPEELSRGVASSDMGCLSRRHLCAACWLRRGLGPAGGRGREPPFAGRRLAFIAAALAEALVGVGFWVKFWMDRRLADVLKPRVGWHCNELASASGPGASGWTARRRLVIDPKMYGFLAFKADTVRIRRCDLPESPGLRFHVVISLRAPSSLRVHIAPAASRNMSSAVMPSSGLATAWGTPGLGTSGMGRASSSCGYRNLTAGPVHRAVSCPGPRN